MAPDFIPGLRLAREFYAASVRPLLEERFPRLPHAAALLGPGSEVLGFDSQRSTDHDWGPRLQVFLGDSDAARCAAPVTAMLASRLPASFRGYPVAFPATREPDGTARHRVQVTGLGAWLTSQLGSDPRYAVTARLVRDLMRLCLLMHRRYPPYSKWLGTAVARLPEGAGLTASLTAAVSAGDWPARKQHLREAYETVAALHNELGLTPPLDPRTRPYYDRPYQVIGAGRFTAALREAITDPAVRRLPATGAVDQFIDSTDAAGDLGFLRACAAA